MIQDQKFLHNVTHKLKKLITITIEFLLYNVQTVFNEIIIDQCCEFIIDHAVKKGI